MERMRKFKVKYSWRQLYQVFNIIHLDVLLLSLIMFGFPFGKGSVISEKQLALSTQGFDYIFDIF